MAELATLLQAEIPEGRSNLADSHANLERVAEYCEANYFQADNKRAALESTKNYTTQSLASVAYQINTLAFNFLQLLELQGNQLASMQGQVDNIAHTVTIHKEKVARREIGILTANKAAARQYKIIAPANPEKPIKYVRKTIDYTSLDEIGHGVRRGGGTPRQRQRGNQAATLPAPTTKPPTPPQTARAVTPGGTLTKSGTLTGTLGKSSSREYRTPPAVAPPQVPSHYAPNYPVGHPHHQAQRRGPGYSTLPIAHPQIGTVHPTQHNSNNSLYGQQQDLHANMPPPPSPLIGSDGVDHGQHSMHQGHARMSTGRGGSVSPPLPPPPPPDEDEHAAFGRPRQAHQLQGSQGVMVSPSPHYRPGQGAVGGTMPTIVPDEEDLPGWVPKNYIEKVVAIYDYYADKEDELSFQESAVVYVLKKNDDGWWEGVMDGITGLFPGNYVEPCV